MAFGMYITVDASDLQSKVEMLKRNMTAGQFERAMAGIYLRTGKHVKAILKEDLPEKYVISQGAVGKAVQPARIAGMGCNIPVVGSRLGIGGVFPASGGAHGWNSLKRKYRINARIVKGQQSTLPAKMKTGHPPFRNLGSSLGKHAFTRTGDERLPIAKVVGIAIPQMPMNRSQNDVQQDIAEFLAKQIEQRFMYLMRGGR